VLAFSLCGGLFVVSAQSSHGTDLRPGRYTDMAGLVRQESKDYRALEVRRTGLEKQIDVLTEQVDSKKVDEAKAKVSQLAPAAGFTEVRGPGVTVTLSDAPAEVINSSTQDTRLLVVHQQDIQAVVNAMWAGGALAVTIQGQRVITTTGIKCQGNAVQLQGLPYSQPYVISAVGPVDDRTYSIRHDDYLEIYREDAALADVSVGWDLQTVTQLVAPPYTGLSDLTYAKPLNS
jgi:uncharacterized protein YlxW (UPF0749 family)